MEDGQPAEAEQGQTIGSCLWQALLDLDPNWWPEEMDAPLSPTKSTRSLGVVFDGNLSFAKQISIT